MNIINSPIILFLNETGLTALYQNVRNLTVHLVYFMNSVGFEVQKYAIKSLQLFLHLKENLNEKLLSHDFYNDAL